jgi:hypothetical protein
MNTGPDSRIHSMGYEKRGGKFEKKVGGWNIHLGEFNVAEQLEGVPPYEEDPKWVKIPSTRKLTQSIFFGSAYRTASSLMYQFLLFGCFRPNYPQHPPRISHPIHLQAWLPPWRPDDTFGKGAEDADEVNYAIGTDPFWIVVMRKTKKQSHSCQCVPIVELWQSTVQQPRKHPPSF